MKDGYPFNPDVRVLKYKPKQGEGDEKGWKLGAYYCDKCNAHFSELRNIELHAEVAHKVEEIKFD